MNLVPDSIFHVYVIVDRWPVMLFRWILMRSMGKQSWKMMVEITRNWVHNLRIILIATQKNYILEAPLGAKPAAGATLDVMNVWQSKTDNYSIVQCAMLYGLEPGLQRRIERHGAYEMF